MSRRKYGKTWWGEAWIRALEAIDINTNRLPRGRSYVGRGLVEEIEIDRGTIVARVQGRRSRPYREKLTLKNFSQQEKEKIMFLIKTTPALGGELAVGRLPQDLLPLLKQEGIELLPVDWDDLKASCSCPDWANPCKHLAAVYYIIGNEIDKDPFLLFQLRGMEKEVLKEIGASGDDPGAEDPFILPHEYELTPEAEVQSSFPDVDFSPRDPGKFLDLLSSSPLFFPGGNFKKKLQQMYKKVARFQQEVELEGDSTALENESFRIIKKEGEFFFFRIAEKKGRGRKSKLNLPVVEDNKLQWKEFKGNYIDRESFFHSFIHTPLLLDEKKYSLPVIFFSAAAAIAGSLALNYSYFPRVIMGEGEDNSFRIEYWPLGGEEKIEKALQYLASIYPSELVVRSRDGALLPPEEGAKTVLALFLTELVHSGFKNTSDSKVEKAFFQGATYSPQHFDEQQTARNIQDWLAPLQLTAGDLAIVLKILPAPEQRAEFLLEVEVEDRKKSSPPVPVKKLWAPEEKVWGQPVEMLQGEVARQLSLAADHLPRLKEILAQKGEKPLGVGLEEMGEFLTGARGILEIMGVRIILPRELQKLVRPRAALTATSPGKINSLLDMERALHFSWEIALGDEKITRDEFKKLAGQASGLVRYRDSYFFITPGEARSLLEKIDRPAPQPGRMEILQGVLTGEIQGNLFLPPEELEGIIREMTGVRAVPLPRNLKGNLRPYQKRGYQWLLNNVKNGFGVCLADDMGLGKTIQAITVILQRQQEGALQKAVLVIAPTSLLGNWDKEIEKFAPDLRARIYHGQGRRLAIKGTDVILTTYQIVQREAQKFKSKDWDLIILDEAQNIKNPQSKRARAIKSLQGEGRMVLTGTPVENRLDELWSIMDFLNPGLLGKRESFRKRFALPIEKYRDKKRLQKLKMAIDPFVLRREKTDRKVISDLPSRIVRNEYCYLTPEQGALYQEIVDQTWEKVENSAGMERRGMIFKLLTALKQVCNHPVQYNKRGQVESRASGKAARTMELLKEIRDRDEKALIFTQYREMGKYLQTLIQEELQEEALFFHGGLQPRKREEMVDIFQEGKKGDNGIMVVSLRAGGTGMNLTRATHVIHYDLWWNPAVENQATDRTHRIGQKKNVLVKRFITLGTLEEKIEELLQQKKELVDLTVSSGEKWISELSNRELQELVQLGDEAVAESPAEIGAD